MPASLMTLFPQAIATLKGLELPLKSQMALSEISSRMIGLGVDLNRAAMDVGMETACRFLPPMENDDDQWLKSLLSIYKEGMIDFSELARNHLSDGLDRFAGDRSAALDFIYLFTEEPEVQNWSVPFTDEDILLDLPGMRLIDISARTEHQIGNYTIVFAPRAGHHSNIAERTAVFLRDQGLTRMAVVEQKCASDIPLVVDGKRHYENFDGQVRQYKALLSHLKDLTGYPPHLVAVCQPGPLLISTLILNPDLGRTFGSAGSPMNTDGERGFLTDFSRLMGENYIDDLIRTFSGTVGADDPGAGREIYDGRLQVLGFYILGMEQHLKNFRRLYTDLKSGNLDAAEKQKQFYDWYNHALHFPAGFIRDTYKKIFVNNELVRGTLSIDGKAVRITDYPAHVPIWGMGGSNDDIAPPKQALGHLDLITAVPDENKLSILADAGHMGLFRSSRVLQQYYTKVVEFILKNSDHI